jgi:aspartyl-tRNA(Asn)/glutamyl-tRNA(Gln) amidotransferase subunit B
MASVKIGLEIHVPLKTGKKLFCDCPTSYHDGGEPNTLTCEICTGMPGVKPRPTNARAVEAVITISHLLNCSVPERKIFMKRKHYNYPDLPKGYQITSEPIGEKGKFVFQDGSFGDIGIWEAHLEEDPGQYNLSKGIVDYNRSGVPLIEIVTAPDITSAEQARAFMKELVRMLEYSDLILGGAGIIRADVNVSINGGNRCEVKNVNSIKSIHRAIEHEIARQDALVGKGHKIEQETRGWDDEKGETYLMRKKESAEDYRYIPDPDLPPFELDHKFVDGLGHRKQETPQEMRARFKEKYKVSEKYAKVLTNDKEVAIFFEQAAAKSDPQLATTWVCEEVLAQLNYRDASLSDTKLTLENFLNLLSLIKDKSITDVVAKKLLERIIDSGESPSEVVKKESLGVIKDEGALIQAVKEVIAENITSVSDYKSGKKEAMNFLMGQVMKKMKGRADAKAISSMLSKELS